MKKRSFAVTLITTILACLICISPMKVQASGTITVPLAGKYSQTEARSMQSMINSFRKGSEAWYWNSDNKTKTVLSGLGDISYDYELEKTAMKRAAEIAVAFSHTRPNGKRCYSAYTIAYSAAGENIAWGYSTAADAFKAWKEDDDLYAGQGHRRNMLSGRYNKMGIGCFVYEGRKFWVQEFASSNHSSGSVAANDSAATVNVELATANVTGTSIINAASWFDSDKVVLDFDEAFDAKSLKEVVGTKVLNSGSYDTFSFAIPNNNISVKDTGIAAIQNGKLVAVKVGTTEITMKSSINGSTMTIPVEVKGKDIKNSYWNLNSGYSYYSGEEITPAPTLIYEGKTLEEGTDYELSYKNNIEPGTAIITVTGKRAFEGSSCTIPFEIRTETLTHSNFSMSKSEYEYTGSHILPSFSISFKGQNLSEGTDYQVSYENNINAGTATITITGLGKFTGSSFSETFTIVKKEVALNVGNDTKEKVNDSKYAPLSKGTSFIASFGIYKVTSASYYEPTVTLVEVNANPKSLKVPAVVYDYNNVAYKVTAIGKNACKGKSRLKSLTVGKNVTTIGSKAFYKCRKLDTITFQSSKVKIGKNAFGSIKSKAKVKVKTGTKASKKSFLKKINKTGGAKNAKLK